MERKAHYSHQVWFLHFAAKSFQFHLGKQSNRGIICIHTIIPLLFVTFVVLPYSPIRLIYESSPLLMPLKLVVPDRIIVTIFSSSLTKRRTSSFLALFVRRSIQLLQINDRRIIETETWNNSNNGKGLSMRRREETTKWRK